MTELRIAKDLLDIGCVILDGANDPAHAGMRPNDGRVRVPFENSFDLVEIRRFRSFLGEGDIHIVMDQHEQPDLTRKIQNPVESRVLQTRDFARNLRGYKFLVY